jgi:hypothetical protein
MLRINGTTGGEIAIAGGGTDYGYMYGNSSNFVIATQTNIPLLFQTNTINRIRVAGTGEVGFCCQICVKETVYVSGTFPSVTLDRGGTTAQSDVKWRDAGTTVWSIGTAVRAVGSSLDFYSYCTGDNVFKLTQTGITCFSNTVCTPSLVACVTSAAAITIDGYSKLSFKDRGTEYGTINASRYNFGGESTLFTFQSGNCFLFLNSTNCLMLIGSSGNVGIGNISPLTKLHVNNAVAGAILPYIQGTGLSYNNEGISVAGSNTNNTNIGNGLTLYNNVASVGAYGPVVAWSSMTAGGAYNATYAFITGVYGGTGGDNNWAIGDLILGTGNAYGATERMRIRNNGNVGIGTTPNEKLDVNGAIQVRSESQGYGTTQCVGMLDFYASATRLLSFGGNGSTCGSFRFYSAGQNNNGGRDIVFINGAGVACFQGTVCAPTFRGVLTGNVNGYPIVAGVTCLLGGASNDVTVYFTTNVRIDYGVNDYTVAAYNNDNSAAFSSLRALIPYNYYQSTVTTTTLASYVDSPNSHSVLAVAICKVPTSNTNCIAVRFAVSSGDVSGKAIQVTTNGIQPGFS